jgi:heme exporter protein A
MLTLDNLSYRRDGKLIYRNFSVSIFCGTSVIVVGKNGSGKTTLLRSIAGLLPAKGRIALEGYLIEQLGGEYFDNINYIPHEDFLDDELKVIENLKFLSELHASELALNAAIRAMQVEDYLDKQMKHLSKGMKKKVHLTTLLLKPSRLWLLDEPFVNLDADGVKRLQEIISVHLDNQGICFVTTNQKLELKNSVMLRLGREENAIL